MTRSKGFIIALSKLMPRQLVVCEGGLSGLMDIQRTATFQTYGIKPSFNDTVKARAESLQQPVAIAFLRMLLWTLSLAGAWPFLVRMVLC